MLPPNDSSGWKTRAEALRWLGVLRAATLRDIYRLGRLLAEEQERPRTVQITGVEGEQMAFETVERMLVRRPLDASMVEQQPEEDSSEEESDFDDGPAYAPPARPVAAPVVKVPIKCTLPQFRRAVR